MRHVEVLFFAADPLSVAPSTRPRLLIDEEAREIRQKVRMSLYRNRLKLNTHWATRTDDLVQALNETQPQVVHFSGHGGGRGLVLVAADGTREHRVDTDGLQEFFLAFPGRIRLVVLNACLSLPQAQAIAEVVGCAIGTPEEITDGAAITFAASFYRAIAFGHSVQTAFDQARAALKLERYEDRECPRLVHRKDVDPRRLVLVRPMIRQAALAATALLLTVTCVAAVVRAGDRAGTGPGSGMADTSVPGVRADSVVQSRGIAALPADASTAPSGSVAGAADLQAALDLRDAGNAAAAFPLLKRAAEAGNTAAMAYLGIAYLNGEGVEKQPRTGIQWLREAADGDEPRGMNALGVAYQQGAGVTRSNRWAKHWYRKAAALGYEEAMRNLGALHQEASAPDSAVYWYRRAAEAGSQEARVDLGLMHEQGEGVPRDTAAALRLYEAAGSAGLARGMVAAGQVYERRGDYGRAGDWYLRGVDAGSAEAMNNLGVLYQNGWGVRADRGQAREWYQRAASAGSRVARSNLELLDGG